MWERIVDEQRIDKAVADNVIAAMQPIAGYSGRGLAGGRPSAAKTGTNQLGDTGANRDAWMVGYTPSLSTAVWVGTTDGTKPLINESGGSVYGSGLPGQIWKSTMDEALERVTGEQLSQLLFPQFDREAERTLIATGMGASPGAAVGAVAFDNASAEAKQAEGSSVILVRRETSPEDLPGMIAAAGILTARGGKTSHAAVVARGMGKCAVVGAEDLVVDVASKEIRVGEHVVREGDTIAIDGKTGEVFLGDVPVVDSPVMTYISDGLEAAKAASDGDVETDELIDAVHRAGRAGRRHRLCADAREVRETGGDAHRDRAADVSPQVAHRELDLVGVAPGPERAPQGPGRVAAHQHRIAAGDQRLAAGEAPGPRVTGFAMVRARHHPTRQPRPGLLLRLDGGLRMAARRVRGGVGLRDLFLCPRGMFQDGHHAGGEAAQRGRAARDRSWSLSSGLPLLSGTAAGGAY